MAVAREPVKSRRRSVRLTRDEADRVREAAKTVGVSASALIRETALACCDAILDNQAYNLDDVIGAIYMPVETGKL